LKQLKTYTPELREEAVKLVLAQGLTLEEAALRLVIPKGTLANWVSAAKRGSTPKAAPGSRTVPDLEAEVAKLRRELAECWRRPKTDPAIGVVPTEN
jgi:transposase